MTPSTVLALAYHPAGELPAPAALAVNRRRRSVPERVALLARFAASGQSAAAFCRAAGLCAVTFSGWRRRQAQDGANVPAAQAVRFAAVRLAPDASAQPAAEAPCLVQLTNGIRIAVTSQVEPAWLAAVLSHVR